MEPFSEHPRVLELDHEKCFTLVGIGESAVGGLPNSKPVTSTSHLPTDGGGGERERSDFLLGQLNRLVGPD